MRRGKRKKMSSSGLLHEEIDRSTLELRNNFHFLLDIFLENDPYKETLVHNLRIHEAGKDDGKIMGNLQIKISRSKDNSNALNVEGKCKGTVQGVLVETILEAVVEAHGFKTISQKHSEILRTKDVSIERSYELKNNENSSLSFDITGTETDKEGVEQVHPKKTLDISPEDAEYFIGEGASILLLFYLAKTDDFREGNQLRFLTFNGEHLGRTTWNTKSAPERKYKYQLPHEWRFVNKETTFNGPTKVAGSSPKEQWNFKVSFQGELLEWERIGAPIVMKKAEFSAKEEKGIQRMTAAKENESHEAEKTSEEEILGGDSWLLGETEEAISGVFGELQNTELVNEEQISEDEQDTSLPEARSEALYDPRNSDESFEDQDVKPDFYPNLENPQILETEVTPVNQKSLPSTVETVPQCFEDFSKIGSSNLTNLSQNHYVSNLNRSELPAEESSHLFYDGIFEDDEKTSKTASTSEAECVSDTQEQNNNLVPNITECHSNETLYHRLQEIIEKIALKHDYISSEMCSPSWTSELLQELKRLKISEQRKVVILSPESNSDEDIDRSLKEGKEPCKTSVSIQNLDVERDNLVQDLQDTFGICGEIEEISAIKVPGEADIFDAVIRYSEEESAEKAIAAFNNRFFHSYQPMSIRYATRRELSNAEKDTETCFKVSSDIPVEDLETGLFIYPFRKGTVEHNQLSNIISPMAPFRSIRIAVDFKLDPEREYAFVQFTDSVDAERVEGMLKGMKICGNIIKTKLATKHPNFTFNTKTRKPESTQDNKLQNAASYSVEPPDSSVEIIGNDKAMKENVSPISNGTVQLQLSMIPQKTTEEEVKQKYFLDHFTFVRDEVSGKHTGVGYAEFQNDELRQKTRNTLLREGKALSLIDPNALALIPHESWAFSDNASAEDSFAPPESLREERSGKQVDKPKSNEKWTLYVEGIDPATTVSHLETMFGTFGPIKDVFMPESKLNKSQTAAFPSDFLRVAFIEFEKEENAKRACLFMNGFFSLSSMLKVSLLPTQTSKAACDSPDTPGGSNRLLIGNFGKELALPSNIEAFTKMLNSIGYCTKSEIPADQFGSHLGYGVFYFEKSDEPAKARDFLHGKFIHGQKLDCRVLTDPPQQDIPSTRLYVGNLPGEIEVADLREIFEAFSDVFSIDLKNTFAFIEIPQKNEKEVVKLLNRYDIAGKKIIVEYCRKSSDVREDKRLRTDTVKYDKIAKYFTGKTFRPLAELFGPIKNMIFGEKKSALVQYVNAEIAQNAARILDQFNLRGQFLETSIGLIPTTAGLDPPALDVNELQEDKVSSESELLADTCKIFVSGVKQWDIHMLRELKAKVDHFTSLLNWNFKIDYDINQPTGEVVLIFENYYEALGAKSTIDGSRINGWVVNADYEEKNGTDQSRDHQAESAQNSDDSTEKGQISNNELISKTIFVSGMGEGVTEAEFTSQFAEFGPIQDAALTFDLDGKPNGTGFITFESSAEAEAAQADMIGYMIGGNSVSVDFIDLEKVSQIKSTAPFISLLGPMPSETKISGEASEIIAGTTGQSLKNPTAVPDRPMNNPIDAGYYTEKDSASYQIMVEGSEMSEQERISLRERIQSFGPVEHCSVMSLSHKGVTNVKAYASYKNEEDAKKACNELNGTTIGESRLKVFIKTYAHKPIYENSHREPSSIPLLQYNGAGKELSKTMEANFRDENTREFQDMSTIDRCTENSPKIGPAEALKTPEFKFSLKPAQETPILLAEERRLIEIKGIDDSMNESNIHSLCSSFGKVEQVSLIMEQDPDSNPASVVTNIRIAQVVLETNENALHAEAALNGLELFGKKIEVSTLPIQKSQNQITAKSPLFSFTQTTHKPKPLEEGTNSLEYYPETQRYEEVTLTSFSFSLKQFLESNNHDAATSPFSEEENGILVIDFQDYRLLPEEMTRFQFVINSLPDNVQIIFVGEHVPSCISDRKKRNEKPTSELQLSKPVLSSRIPTPLRKVSMQKETKNIPTKKRAYTDIQVAKDFVKSEDDDYLLSHPELNNLLCTFTDCLLRVKPTQLEGFAADYFKIIQSYRK